MDIRLQIFLSFSSLPFYPVDVFLCFSEFFFFFFLYNEVLLRNLYTGHEATVRTGHGTTDWFQIGKGQGCILSPCLFNLHAQYIMRNTGLDEAQARINIAGRNIKTADMQMIPPLWQKAKKN